MDKNKVLTFMASKTYMPLKFRELAKRMGVLELEYSSFRRLVRELIRDGHIIKLKKNRLGLPEKLNLIVGKLVANKKGFGFVVPEDNSPDIYIHPQEMGQALHGDKVIVRLNSHSTGTSREGSIIKVLQRGIQSLVGTFKRTKYFSFVEPDDKRIIKDIYIPEKFSKDAEVGQKVVVLIENWQDPHLAPEGKITEILGFPEEPGLDMLTVVKNFGLSLSFPADVLKETEKVPDTIPQTEIKRRLDLRKKVCFTIDPIDAKDHDDAVSLEILKNGNYLLGVHIADVSFYVAENSALDKEALNRSTSVYLADRVIPMLPEKLSNRICSLLPQVDRLTFSCLMEVNRTGNVQKYEIKETVIKSRAKLAYEEVQAFFDTGNPGKNVSGLEKELKEMLTLSKILYKKREAVGSLDFDLPEAKVVLDENGKVLDIFKIARLESHRLIEEFMLLANQTVALHTARLSMPFLYRVHDKPDPEKIASFSYFVDHLGYNLSLPPVIKPKFLQRFLIQIEGQPEEEIINEILLRSLKKAVYQPENIGHFGLAFSHYTHFTSPIRRYPDLMVHRMLKDLKNGKYTVERYKKLVSILPKIGQMTSERERMADEAERESIKVKEVEFMQDKLGEIFGGVISGVSNFGFWVRLNRTLIEGLVHVSSLEDDYYVHQQERERLVGRHTKRVFALGDKVTVQLTRVDKDSKEIDFRLVRPEITISKAKKFKKSRKWRN